ncbi:hypothetical protein KKI93_06060 [Xenorhabdus bovienii]|uniref:hypothetical protein n=1 Tax=Xenorhabdus bovienii TaxID=40576 RepID=UPI0023B2C90D|nr:hypothetical protein [Xenorhabdus bovienii]MDE9542072.1 hypothetical protein [Xenorhabdus bovienii]MDE9563640.1 hypothetical protein [Xenorhabdus bovienii]
MKNRKTILHMAAAAIVVGLLPGYFLIEFSIIFGKRDIPIEIEKWGYFGSFLSGILSLLSISILLSTLFFTIYYHRKEIDLLSEEQKMNNFNRLLDSLVDWMRKTFHSKNRISINIENLMIKLSLYAAICSEKNGTSLATPWQACRHEHINPFSNSCLFNEIVPLVKELISIAKSSKTDVRVFKALLTTKISRYECFLIALDGYDNDKEFPYIVTGWEMFENHPFEELEQVATLDAKKGKGNINAPKVPPENANFQ